MRKIKLIYRLKYKCYSHYSESAYIVCQDCYKTVINSWRKHRKHVLSSSKELDWIKIVKRKSSKCCESCGEK